jgi:hypothetical protein
MERDVFQIVVVIQTWDIIQQHLHQSIVMDVEIQFWMKVKNVIMEWDVFQIVHVI